MKPGQRKEQMSRVVIGHKTPEGFRGVYHEGDAASIRKQYGELNRDYSALTKALVDDPLAKAQSEPGVSQATAEADTALVFTQLANGAPALEVHKKLKSGAWEVKEVHNLNEEPAAKPKAKAKAKPAAKRPAVKKVPHKPKSQARIR